MSCMCFCLCFDPIGRQVKMLLGEDCAVPLKITRAVYEEAERRLHNMAFVGLTDAFNASVSEIL